MKKRTNTQTLEVVTSSSTLATDSDIQTLEESQAQNEELEWHLQKYKGMSFISELAILTFKNSTEKQKLARDAIKPIIRHKGEAGSRKRGFI